MFFFAFDKVSATISLLWFVLYKSGYGFRMVIFLQKMLKLYFIMLLYCFLVPSSVVELYKFLFCIYASQFQCKLGMG